MAHPLPLRRGDEYHVEENRVRPVDGNSAASPRNAGSASSCRAALSRSRNWSGAAIQLFGD